MTPEDDGNLWISYEPSFEGETEGRTATEAPVRNVFDSIRS